MADNNEVRKNQETENGPEQKETLLESMAGTALMIVVWLFVVTFVVQNFEIPSSSMEKTMLIGDHLVVDHSTLEPAKSWMPLMHYRPVQHGDIIVFLKPNPEQPDFILVKRAIGLPGDHIRLRHGTVYRNGVALNEPQAAVLNDSSSDYEEHYNEYRDDFPAYPAYGSGSTEVWATELPSHIQNGELVVPPGMVFAMGDNRTHSLDSRYWGFVPQDNILGRPLFVYWSFVTSPDQINKTSASDRVAFVVHIITHFVSDTRWKRTFHRVL